MVYGDSYTVESFGNNYFFPDEGNSYKYTDRGHAAITTLNNPLYAGDKVKIVWTLFDESQITPPRFNKFMLLRITDEAGQGYQVPCKYTGKESDLVIPSTPGTYALTARDNSTMHTANKKVDENDTLHPDLDGNFLYICRFTVVAANNSVGGKTLNQYVNEQLQNFTYDGNVKNAIANLSEYVKVVGGTQSATDAGSYSITLEPRMKYAWDSTGSKAAKTFTWKINKANQTLTYKGNTSVNFGSNLTLSTSSTAGNQSGNITYSVNAGTGSATISGNTLIPTKAGTITLTITAVGSNNYNSATITKTITINKTNINSGISTNLASYTQTLAFGDNKDSLKLPTNFTLTYNGYEFNNNEFTYTLSEPDANGNVKVYVTSTATSNYTFNNVLAGQFKVNKVNQNVSIKNSNISYSAGQIGDATDLISGQYLTDGLKFKSNNNNVIQFYKEGNI